MNYLKEKAIPYFFLYDTRGSELFNEITKLEEYYPFKKEQEILNQYADKLVDFQDDMQTEKITLVEFGAGYSEKTNIIIKKLLEKNKNIEFVPIDVSESACELTYRTYKDLCIVKPFIGTYDMYIDSNITYPNRVIYLWLGSSIGNLKKDEQKGFLKKLSEIMTFRDMLLIGFDTVYKDKEIIKQAYNDKEGVTAKFILNILSHLKEKYKLSIEENNFTYHIEYNEIEERVEMYLKCINDSIVSEIENNRETYLIKKDEKIFIEYSHKFSLEKIEDLASNSNLILKTKCFTDDKYFMFCTFLKDITSVWNRTEEIFKENIKYENINEQPIDLRNKFIFYLGHLYTFYDIRVFNLSINDPYYSLFERGRDPNVEKKEYCHRHSNINLFYPHYYEILNYNKRIKDQLITFIKNNSFTFNLLCSIEHEMMHQETLFYMIRFSKNCFIKNSLPQKYKKFHKNIITIPRRIIEQGSNESFVWDNETPKDAITVEEFKVDNLPVTWGDIKDFLVENSNLIEKYTLNSEINNNFEFIEKFNLDDNKENININGFLQLDKNQFSKNNLNKKIRIPNINEKMQIRISENDWIDYEKGIDLPAWVSLDVANAFVNWKKEKGTNCRIMTENEFDSLASSLTNIKGGNVNYKNFHAMPIGFYNDFSNDGIGELFGNGWELTSSLFKPFEDFKPMEIYREYSTDFFSDHHYVLKGASPYTSSSIIRKSFRNWYQEKYNYQASKFRLVYY